MLLKKKDYTDSKFSKKKVLTLKEETKKEDMNTQPSTNSPN